MHVTHDATVVVLSSAFTHSKIDIHCHMNNVTAATATASYETLNGNTIKNFYIHCSPTMTNISTAATNMGTTTTTTTNTGSGTVTAAATTDKPRWTPTELQGY